MLLNRFEKRLVNNPLRDRMLRRTVSVLLEMAGHPPIAQALEIGCGEGAGMAAIARTLQPATLDAFDLDPEQVARAKERLQSRSLAAGRLWTGDAERIEAPDETYDAVFEFTILHHVPNWPQALREIARVLRPGGHFLFEELSREFFYETGPLGWSLRRYTDHPWVQMFDWSAFEEGLDAAGLKLTCHRAPLIQGWHHGVAVRK
jgi:ubiquinone/menaquinone biosynthesis C-methylase UbiE